MFEITQRLLLAFLSGYFLCLSGSLSQLTTHNPLSSPSTLGFTGVGVLSILGGFFIQKYFLINTSLELIGTVIFLILLLAIFLIVKMNPKTFKHLKNFILLGIAFNLFVGAIFSIVNFIFISRGIQFPSSIWFGNFRFTSIESLVLFMILFFLSILFVRGQARKLELMNLGDLFARNLGVKTSRVTMMSLGVSLILTSVVVIHFGVFSFVGLVLPHIVRSMKFFKYSIRRELYFGPIICGIILLGLDLLCYQVTIYGAEFPVGMLSAVFGSFALITVLFRSGNMNS